MNFNKNFKEIDQQNYFLKSRLNQEQLINLAINCIIIEAKSYPSFGLVSQYDSGCHKDMNFTTFLASAKTFTNYFQEIYNLVTSNKTLNFSQLRKLGQKQEARMYQATNNINTHKGLIFHYGIIFYIISYQNYYQTKIRNYQRLIKTFTWSLKFDFINFNNKTKGEQLYYQYQITGARGLALNGYQIIFDDGLKFLKFCQANYPKLDQEQLALLLLVFYLSKIEDTTLISKIGYQKSKAMNEQANQWLKILTKSGYDKFYQTILNNNQRMKIAKISPGGCADLVVITLFLGEILLNNKEF